MMFFAWDTDIPKLPKMMFKDKIIAFAVSNKLVALLCYGAAQNSNIGFMRKEIANAVQRQG